MLELIQVNHRQQQPGRMRTPLGQLWRPAVVPGWPMEQDPDMGCAPVL